MEKIQINKEGDSYFIDKSFINEKESCIHVPVNMLRKKGIPDINISLIDKMEEEVRCKYKELTFTDRWDVSSGENGIKDYKFFYQKL